MLVARCEHDAVMPGPSGEMQFMNVKTLNEWDPRVGQYEFLLWKFQVAVQIFFIGIISMFLIL